MKKILIIKMSSLGDIIHAFPVLPYIHEMYPDVKIDWAVEKPFAELVEAHPLVHKVIRVQTKKWRKNLFRMENWKEIAAFRRELRSSAYDLVIDLQGNTKSGLVTGLSKSSMKAGFGYSSVFEWPNLLSTHKRFNPPVGHNVREEYLYLVQSALDAFAPFEDHGVQLHLNPQEESVLHPILEHIEQFKGMKVLVCPGSNWTNKQLSNETLEVFLTAFSLKYDPHFFFLWGHPEEKIAVEALAASLPKKGSVLDKLPLPALQNLIGKMDLVVAMDSLPLHLAGTTSTPTYSIFGPSSSLKYKPAGDRHESFQGSCPYGKSFERRCDILRTCQTGACMKQLDGNKLFDHFCSWWSTRTKF